MSRRTRKLGVFVLPLVVVGALVVSGFKAVGQADSRRDRETNAASAMKRRRPPMEHTPRRDYWITSSKEQTYQDLTVPSAFFGDGCDRFEGRVQFVGSPLDPAKTRNVDTILRRYADPVERRDPVGSVRTVSLEMEELSLVSKRPIRVLCNGEAEQWMVHVGLSPTAPQQGSLTATKTHPNGGTFDSTIYVQPLLTFTSVADPHDVLILDTADVSDPIAFTTEGAPFVLDLIPPSSRSTRAGAGFFPGVAELEVKEALTRGRIPRLPPLDGEGGVGGRPSVYRETAIVSHTSPGHQHGVEPPVGACCDDEGWCTITTRDECSDTYLGDGIECDPDPCPTPPPDYWATWSDGSPGWTYKDLTIPSEFFGPECEAFTGRVEFEGEPLDPAVTGNADTIIQRSADPVLPADPIGAMGTVTIEIVELSLVSLDPITVFCNAIAEEWDVSAGLSPTAPPLGSLTATKTGENGGTFDSTLFVQPLLTFTKVGEPGNTRTLDTAGVSPPLEFIATDVPFVHDLLPGLEVVAGLDAQFIPGVLEGVLPEITTQNPLIISEEGLLARHTITPPKFERCIYEVACIDGDCQQCPLREGDICLGVACPGGTCAGSFTRTCGEDGCCLEYTLIECGFPDSEPECPVGDPCACDPTEGACCLPDEWCVETTGAECIDLGGIHVGDGTDCGTPNPCVGCCMLCDGTSTITTEEECTAPDALYLGDGTECPPIGACCSDDGTCVETHETCCTEEYEGDDVPCDEDTCRGACCVDEDTCAILSRLECGDRFQWNGAPCGPTLCTDRNCDAVTVTIDNVVRGPGLPASVPYRKTYEVAVTISPNLAGTEQSIVFDVINNSADNGTSSIDGTNTLQCRGKIKIKGDSQTKPGHSGQLKLRARCGGVEKALSNGFSVCAHPSAMGFDFDAILDPLNQAGVKFWGVRYTLAPESDSGTTGDLDKTKVSENIVKVKATGYWSGIESRTSKFNQTTASQKDRHADGGAKTAAIMKKWMDDAKLVGKYVVDQFFRFFCERCGIAEDKANGPKVPVSGFRVTTTMSKNADAPPKYFFHTKKEGKANNGVAAGVVDDTNVKDAEVKD